MSKMHRLFLSCVFTSDVPIPLTLHIPSAPVPTGHQLCTCLFSACPGGPGSGMWRFWDLLTLTGPCTQAAALSVHGFSFEAWTRPHPEAQASFKHAVISLLEPLECWESMLEPPHSASL